MLYMDRTEVRVIDVRESPVRLKSSLITRSIRSMKRVRDYVVTGVGCGFRKVLVYGFL